MAFCDEDMPPCHSSDRICYVDPRNIVNVSCVRPVTEKDMYVVEQSFLRNGYIDILLISCRLSTFPELQAFFRREPFNYSPEKSAAVAKAEMEKGDTLEYFYCYDGHIRKFVTIRLIEQGVLPPGFKLKSVIKEHMSDEEEIAYSLSRNGVNEYSVPLYFLALLLRCREFDDVVNKGKKKPLSAVEVGKRMVFSTHSTIVDERVRSKLAETRRQVIGICRKLPECVIAYLREMLATDVDGKQAALTIANMKAIKGKPTDQEYLALVKIFFGVYENCLPGPKPIHSKRVSEQLCNVRLAICEIEKFKCLCDYDSVPSELNKIVESMLWSQSMNDELSENQTSDRLLPAMAEGCKNLVPSGTVHLARAEKKLTGRESAESTVKDPVVPDSNQNADPQDTVDPNATMKHPEISKTVEETMVKPGAVKPGESLSGVDLPVEDSNEDDPVVAGKPENGSSTGGQPVTENRKNPENCDPKNDGPYSQMQAPGTTEERVKACLPRGWNLAVSSFEDFYKHDGGWKLVQGKADLVLWQLGYEQNNDADIRECVRHAGVAMKLSGVTHMFCSHLQFGKIHAAALGEGMECMPFMMLYVEDPKKTKKRTPKQRPQEITRSAAVFWRSPDASMRHHFSTKQSYPRSETPAWTNSATNVRPCSSKLKKADGSTLSYQDWDKDVLSHILKQWCRPAGLCYNPSCGVMGASQACYDLGIQYIGVEPDLDLFDAGAKRLLEYVQGRVTKKPRLSDGSVSDPPLIDDGNEKTASTGSVKNQEHCAIGDRCRFNGNKPAHACRVCGLPMHGLCDYGLVVMNCSSESRELKTVCSKACFDGERN